MTEEWKEILGFDILYEVSNFGRVRTRYSEKNGYTKEYRIIEPLNNGKGYLRFNWRQSKKQRTVYLHRLVAEAFLDNPEKLSEINHKDEYKKNNRADNLEWCSHIYNANYGTRNERAGIARRKPVLCIETGVLYPSTKDAAKAHGVAVTAISNCLSGRSHKSCGLSWRYANA